MTKMIAYTVVALLAALAGCSSPEHDAKMLIEPEARPGRMVAKGSPADKLLGEGRISACRRIKGEGGCMIDVWVINSSLADPTELGHKVVRGTVVLLHPLMMSKVWFLKEGEMLARRGWDVVLPDLRAHGQSEGQYTTWGVKERLDLKLVMDQLVGDKTVSPRIFAIGGSLGGMVAIQYAAIDSRCQGVMAFAPPSDLRRIGRRILSLTTSAQYERGLAEAGKMGDFSIDDASAVVYAKRLTCSLIIVHGGMDMIVPYDQCREVFDAAGGPKQFISRPLSGHAAEFASEKWVADRVDELEKLKK
jgi:pimeloyl-ACP methyl ester carboxylesterase